MIKQPLPILGENRGAKQQLFQAHVQEPVEQNIVIQHLAEQTVRADRLWAISNRLFSSLSGGIDGRSTPLYVALNVGDSDFRASSVWCLA